MKKVKAKRNPTKSISNSKKKYLPDILYIIILAIVVIIVYNKVYDKKLFLVGDNVVYYITGKAIASGQGYTNINSPFNSPATWFPPGYPFISAIVMSLFGKDIEVMNKANGFFLFGSLIFLYLISCRFTKNKHLAFVIAMITGLNVHILNYSIIAMSEIPFIFGSLGAIYFFMRMEQALQTRASFMVGETSASFWYRDINVWVFFSFLILSYYIRPTGIALLGATVLYLLKVRNWRMAIIISAGFILCLLPWSLRNSNIKENRYERMVLKKNTLQTESGEMKSVNDWVTRIENNCKRYVTIEIPSAMLGYIIDKQDVYTNPLPKDRKWITGFLFIALGITGLFCVREYKWFIVFYLSGTVAILLLFPDVWYGIRLMLTIVPLIYMLIILALYDGLSWLARKTKLKEQLRVSFLPFIFLVFIFVLKNGINYLANYSENGILPPAYVQYFELAKWAKTNIPANSVVACRKPELFYLYSECKTTNYKFTQNADSLIANLKSNKATHAVIEELGFSSTGLYLKPAVQKYPEKFKIIKYLPNPDTYLFEIHYECGYTGEMKDGKRNGKGISRNADGTVYDGYWKNGLRDGKGTYTWANGSKFEGVFSNNMRNGPGVFYDIEKKHIIKSNWTNDTLNGYTKIYDMNNNLLQEGIINKNENGKNLNNQRKSLLLHKV